MASGNIINDIYDVAIDKINKPHRPLPSNKITVKEAYVIYFILLFISIFISALINEIVIAIVLGSIVMLFFYSKYLKRIPIVGNIVVAFLTGLVFIYGGFVVENPKAAIVPAVFAFLINLIREIVKDMEDVEGDKTAGLKTLPIRFGFQKSKSGVLSIMIFLIGFTFYPFVTHLYKIEYFIVVLIVVNPILIYSSKMLFENHSAKNLYRVSNLLKLNMVLGLIAIYFGV
jgi:geranylgeranylglycerol-phosphate geranylgeranyltransferase